MGFVERLARPLLPIGAAIVLSDCADTPAQPYNEPLPGAAPSCWRSSTSTACRATSGHSRNNRTFGAVLRVCRTQPCGTIVRACRSVRDVLADHADVCSSGHAVGVGRCRRRRHRKHLDILSKSKSRAQCQTRPRRAGEQRAHAGRNLARLTGLDVMPRHPRRPGLAALAGDSRSIALDPAALEPRWLLGEGRAPTMTTAIDARSVARTRRDMGADIGAPASIRYRDRKPCSTAHASS